MSTILRFFFALLLSAPVCAGAESPDALVRRVTDEVMQIVLHDEQIKAGDTERAVALVEEKVLPHFEFQRMTALAVGQGWRKASAEQKGRLVSEFTNLLVRTYSSALSLVEDQKLEIKPLQLKPEETRVLVRSRLLQSAAEPIEVDYRMIRKGADWKVYDVIVGGVSLVTTYRNSFAEEIRGSGIDGLIDMLAAKNQQLREKAPQYGTARS